MSEFQYVGFRAVDRPVDSKNLAYMRQQSTRAEITPRSFDNEYHYGGFRGDALEMLRCGYDIHLHYANYGTRRLLIRLPQGLPDAKAAEPYFLQDSLEFKKDKSGKGGVLEINPWNESEGLDELWDLDQLIDRLVPLRAEIIEGDLRPLYLANLAIFPDSLEDSAEAHEAPVPTGLKKLSDAQQALVEFLGLGDALVAAAALESPALADGPDPLAAYTAWLRRRPNAAKTEWLARLLIDANSPLRAELLAKFRSEQKVALWPTTTPNRTLAQLVAAAEEIAQEKKRKTAAASARQHAQRLKKMSDDPQPFLRETEQLVAKRTTTAYRQVAKILAELREALAYSGRSGLAEKQAQQLKRKNPTLAVLTAELRRQGFVPK